MKKETSALQIQGELVSGSSLSTEQRLATHVVRKPKLLKQLHEALRSRHYSRRTEQTYCQWVKRFIYFHKVRRPAEMAEPFKNYSVIKTSKQR